MSKNEPIEVDRDDSGEKGLAYEIMEEYAKEAQQTNMANWSQIEVMNVSYYDDTDGSGVHPNRPGVTVRLQITSPSNKLYQTICDLNENIHHTKEEGVFFSEPYSHRKPSNLNKQPVYLSDIAKLQLSYEKTDKSFLEMFSELNNLPKLSSKHLAKKLPSYIVMAGEKPEELYFLTTKGARCSDNSIILTGEAIELNIDDYIAENYGMGEMGDAPEGGDIWDYVLQKKNIGDCTISLGAPIINTRSSLARILNKFDELSKVKKDDTFYDYMWHTIDYIANELEIPLK